MTSNGRKPQIMERTITQNGALFAVQHKPVKRNYFQHHTDRSQAPIKQSPLYERLSENLSFAKLRSAVISSLSSAMLVGHSDYTGRMKRLCAR